MPAAGSPDRRVVLWAEGNDVAFTSTAEWLPYWEYYAPIVQAAGVPCDTVREVHDQPYRAIIDSAHALSCDLIVMASHGRRGISALLLGSETVKVLTHSTIPVLVYR